MIIHLAQSDIDGADRVTNPVARAIARTLGVDRVILFKADPPTEYAKDIRGFYLRWAGVEIYLPYRAQIICFAWEYGAGIVRMKVRTKAGMRMVDWDEIVKPCAFDVDGLKEQTK